MPRFGRFGHLAVSGAGWCQRHSPLLANALMHLVSDGCFVALYPVLPLIAGEFHLSYVQVGMLKTALSSSSTAFQLPMALLAEHFGDMTCLAVGMGWVAVGLMVIGLAGSFRQALLFTFGAGCGGSVQHPVASAFISREYEGRKRGSALGILNFAGDLGKFTVPAVFALSLSLYGWRQSLGYLGAVSLAFSLGFWYTLHDRDHRGRDLRPPAAHPAKGWGILHPSTFTTLLSMGVLDASVRNTLLTFVPFLLMEKGMTEAAASLLLTVIFAGGAAGKLLCGLLADRVGTTTMIMGTEALTGLLILWLLPTSRWSLFPLLFFLGFFLNGTSSVLLDGVADLFQRTKRARGYGLYFTIYLGAGALGPLIYGFVGDAQGLHRVFIWMAAGAFTIIPIAGLYNLYHRQHQSG